MPDGEAEGDGVADGVAEADGEAFADGAADGSSGLPRPQQRTCEQHVWSVVAGESQAEVVSLFVAARRQLAEVVGLPRSAFGMPDEHETHRPKV